MKVLMSIFLLSLSFVSLAEKVKVYVPGMTCQMCVKAMQKSFGNVVKDKKADIVVDLDKDFVVIDTVSVISDEEIKKRVKSAGYKAKKIERLN